MLCLFILSPPPINNLLLRKVYDIKLYFLIYLAALGLVAHKIFTATCGFFSCGMWDPVP